MANRLTAKRPSEARARGKRDAEATREALLAAGTDLFAERGFDGVTVALIADRAGVNKAMVSYHFGGKRQLYVAILHETFAEMLARLEPLRTDPRSADELLREVVRVIGEVATGRRPHFSAMLLREVLSRGQHLERDVIAYPVRILSVVRDIVERGVRERRLRPVDPVLTHLSLVGSLVFFFATARFRERVLAEGRMGLEAPTAEAYVRHIQELMSRGLASGPVNVP